MTRAYARALNYLTARNRTVQETTDYLHRKDYSASEIQEAIGLLLELDLLNDQRTAVQWVDYCLDCKPRGRERLRIDLLKRGIDKVIIEEVLGRVDDDCEFELALRILSTRAIQDWPRDKLYRFLRNRGFTFVIIERVYLYYKNLTQD